MTKLYGFSGMTLAIVAFGVLSGCSRPQPESSHVSFALPSKLVSSKASGQSAGDIEMILVRISGAGMPSVAFNWQAREICEKTPDACANGNFPAPPTSVNFEVPKGERLFQVLILAGASGDRSQIIYGDALKTLSADIESVKIQMAEVGGAGIEGQVAGRYLTSADAGPTGTLQMQFNPPGGRPAMEIMNGDIVNGWFQATFLENAKVTYVVKESGLKIFDQQTLVDISNQVSAATPHLRRVDIPAFSRERDSQCEVESASRLITGFFGQVPAAAQACESGSVSGAYVSGCTGALVSWPTGTGGAATCSSDPAVKKVKVNVSNLRNGTHDLVMFRGPFEMREITSGGGSYWDFMEGQITSGNLALTWSYIEGAQSVLEGLEFYHGNSELDPYQGIDDGVNCAKIATSGLFARKTVAASATTTTLTGIISGTRGAVCPFYLVGTEKRYLSGHRLHMLEHQGGGMGGGWVGKLAVNIPSVANIATNTCQQVSVSLFDMSGNPSTASSDVYVHLETSWIGTGSFEISNSAACTSTNSSQQAVITSGNSSAIFWVQATSEGFTKLRANAPNYQQGFATLSATAASGTPDTLEIASNDTDHQSGSYIAGQCFEARAYLKSGADMVPSISAYSFTPTGNLAGGSVSFHSDPMCTTALGSISIPVGHNFGTFFVKPLLATGTNSLSLNVSSLGGLTTGPTFSGSVEQPTAGTLSLDFYSYDPGECRSVGITPRTSTYTRIKNLAAPVSGTIGVSSGTGTLHTQSNCGDAGVSSLAVTAPTGGVQAHIFARSYAANFEIQSSGSGLTASSGGGTRKLAHPGITTSSTWGSYMMTDVCYPLGISLTTGMGSPYLVPDNYSLSVTPMPFTNEVVFADDDTCSSNLNPVMSSGSIDFGSNSNGKNLFFRFNSAATGGTLGFSFQQYTDRSNEGWGLRSDVAFEVTNPACSPSCQAVEIGYSGAPNPNVTSDLVFLLAASGTANFYSDAGCTASVTGTQTVSLPAGTLKKTYYFKGNTSESLTVTPSQLTLGGHKFVGALNPHTITCP